LHFSNDERTIPSEALDINWVFEASGEEGIHAASSLIVASVLDWHKFQNWSEMLDYMSKTMPDLHIQGCIQQEWVLTNRFDEEKAS